MDYDLEGCGGCKTCEIACSLKQTGDFNVSTASIEIIANANGIGYFVRLIDDISSGRIPCDACLDIEGEPMCVRYCHQRDGLLEIIKQFIVDSGLENGT